MAQIVTITNPLTGQPAQVDQLDHTAQEIDDAIARALPGGAIDELLAGKAPSGYGLGGNAASPTTNDADSCTLTGWYAISSMSNCPFTYGLLRVEKWYNRCIFQTAYEMSSGVVVQRRYQNSEWKPWEYVNPPMALGVEYRTTERYMGKPVYAKARTYEFESSYDSASQFGLEIPHEISNFGSLVRAEAVSPPYMIPYVSKNGGFAGVRAVNATNILFDSYKTSWSSGNKITFKLFYTKS